MAFFWKRHQECWDAVSVAGAERASVVGEAPWARSLAFGSSDSREALEDLRQKCSWSLDPTFAHAPHPTAPVDWQEFATGRCS